MSQFFSAWHFDGVTAVRRTVAIEVDGPQFTLVESDSRASPARSGPFAFAELKAQNSAGAARTFGLNGRDGWRLGLEGPIPAELQAHLPAPEKYGRWVDRLGLGPASIVFALVSVAAVAVVVWSPQWLAPLIPASVEQNLGDAMVGDFGGRFCATPEGTAALNKLTASLDQHPGDLQVEVANIDMINAVALPGNKVVLFNGLVAQAETPDEVAGVLAHEIGHVRQRHVMQGLLRQMGLAVVLGGFDGSGGSSINSLLSTTYTRGAEREADEHSLAAMKRADVSPVGTADFFRRLSAMDGSDAMNDKGERAMAGYLSSHPLSDERRQFFEKSLVKGKAYQPALSYDEWQELKTMCAKDKDVKSGWGFDMD